MICISFFFFSGKMMNNKNNNDNNNSDNNDTVEVKCIATPKYSRAANKGTGHFFTEALRFFHFPLKRHDFNMIITRNNCERIWFSESAFLQCVS